MNVLVIDGQGGRLGAAFCEGCKKRYPETDITAVGTNATATAMMLRAGADRGATGENPVVVAARKADVIVGPIGMIAADALLGEMTAAAAAAVGSANAHKLLIPVNRCGLTVVGVRDLPLGVYVELALDEIGKMLG